MNENYSSDTSSSGLEKIQGMTPIGRDMAGLNRMQRQAVETHNGALLVLAGAGTGKTRVLTTRLAHLLATGSAKPWTVLAVTFTNKAAREMRERVRAIIGPVAEEVWLGTFHALCTRILRRHSECVGLKSNFTILDTDDQLRLIKQILQSENIDEKKWPARLVLGVIQRWKDRGLRPGIIDMAEVGDLVGGRLVDIYSLYQNRLKVLNAADFGDLLLHCLTLFNEQPDILKIYQNRFSHILVDEYQDTNVAQYLWLRLLAQARKNICCVGDDDQSIYGWRGAEVENILRFEKDFPGAKIVRLEQNYRSSSLILEAASALISFNEGRLGKTLWTDGDQGEKIVLRSVWDGEAEARAVGEQIEILQRNGTPLKEIAILVRAGFQTREFEDRFLTLGLPYQVIGGARFYERAEIRDAIAYFRVIYQPNDDLALERIINKPKRGIGRANFQAIHHLARTSQISLWDAINNIIQTQELRPTAIRSLSKLIDNFNRWRSLLEVENHAELAGIVLDESGYTEMLQSDKSPEAPGRLENLKELVSAIEEFENLGIFLEHISLVMENVMSINGDHISLMTLHAAKGLEFDVVFLPGWEEGIFPNQRSLDENGLVGLEEERRLAYVGLTRARRSVEISFSANRRLYGNWQSTIPSRFVDELPEKNLEVESEIGLFSGVSGAENNGFGDSSWHGISKSWRGTPIGNTGAQYRTGYERQGNIFNSQTPNVDGERYIVNETHQSSFTKGDRVFHQKFGMGTVTNVDGDKLDITFDKAGDKKVMASFVSQP